VRSFAKGETKGKGRLGFSAYGLLFTFFSLLFFFSNCAPAKKPVSRMEKVLQEKGFDLIPKSEEKLYSQKIASDIENEAEIMEDEFLNIYLDELGKKIISRTHFHNLVGDYEWSFKIIDSSEVNAFAALGGKVYVYRGLIEAAEVESELTGILAFEIAHVMARHVPQHLSQKAVIQGTVLPGEMIRGDRGLENLYQVFEAEGGVFSYFANLKYYPDEIEKTDEFALHNSYDAGFNPQGLVDFAKRLWEKDRQKPASLWMQRNPWSLKRQNHALAILNLFSPFIYPEESSKFAKLKTHLESLIPLPSKEEEPFIPEYTEVLRMSVMGNIDWTDTGLDVVEGQEIYFQASGGISLQKGNPLVYCSPKGYSLKTMLQPLSDRNIGALIGKVVKLISVEIDEETGEEIRNEIFEYFFIGSESKLRITMEGHLFLGINENIVGDNSGEFKVTLYRKKVKN